MNLDWKSKTKFHIQGLNQEKVLNEISKSVPISDVDSLSKNETFFKCPYFSRAKVEKILKSRQVKILDIAHQGPAGKLGKIFASYGAIAALVLVFSLQIAASGFVLQYQVLGAEHISAAQISNFVKSNFSHKKSAIDTSAVEVALLDNFDALSFASCIIKGQTLLINIKEKLLPNEMYGDFAPIVAAKSGKITQISLISGTLCCKVGDVVRAGDVLVQPFAVDTSGQNKQVEAKAEILADVYYEGTADHYETYIQVTRTGRKAVQNEIRLFGLPIYIFKEEMPFEMFEVESEELPLIKNLVLPFKIFKNVYYELQKNTIISKFEDVEEQIVEKARQNALEKCENCDKIKEEFHTTRHFSGMTIVSYCLVVEENLCAYKAE